MALGEFSFETVRKYPELLSASEDIEDGPGGGVRGG